MRVLMRAICLRTLLISAVFSSWPVALRKRRLSASCFVARSSSINSPRLSSVRSFFLPAMSDRLFTGDDACLDRQLLDRLLEGDASLRLVGERQLEERATRLHDGHPEFGVALAGTHASLGRLLGDGLVREHTDPDLAAALDRAGHGDTGRFDLAGGEPARLERLDSVLAVVEAGASLGHSLGATAVVL